MKALLAMLTIVLLALGVTACGSTNKAGAGSNASTSAPKKDRDNDSDQNDDDGAVLNFGHAASAAEMRPLTTLVRGYFAAAAAGDGAQACKLLMPFVAESVVEDLRRGPGLNGDSCAVVMSKLFAQNHTELADKSATLKFYAVRVGAGKALTVLSFSSPSLAPEVRQLIERRDSSGTWKVLSLLDGILE